MIFLITVIIDQILKCIVEINSLRFEFIKGILKINYVQNTRRNIWYS